MHEILTTAVDDPERLSVYLSRGFAMLTRLNGLRSYVGVSISQHLFDAALAKLLRPLV